MGSIDKATRWSLGLWLMFGLGPVLYHELPWLAWKQDDKLAVWVQAFGSIAAIVGAFMIARRAEKQAETVRRRSTYNLVRNQAIDTMRHLIGLQETLRKKDLIYIASNRENLRIALSQYSIADLSTLHPDVQAEVLNFRSICVHVRYLADHWSVNSPPELYVGLEDNFAREIARAKSAFDVINSSEDGQTTPTVARPGEVSLTQALSKDRRVGS